MRWRRTAPPPRTPEPLGTLRRLVGDVDKQIDLQMPRIELAAALQRAMLPPQLPDVPGLRIAARYAPARDGLAVGGDWYDAFLMPDGSVALAIGDVQGHGMDSIAFMGQVRTGLRAIATVTTDPGKILGSANDLFISMACDLFATCCFLRMEVRTGELAGVRAGHPPVVWATVGGRSGTALDEGGLPLGIQPHECYPVTRRRLTEPGAFVLLTDGVVEGPSFPVEEGLAQVARLVTAHAGADPDVLAAEVIKVADLTGHSDDAAVLAVRYDGTAG
ncbi:serine/threonine protein phosphatase [Streptomyces griseocarneus]|nr:serine/threonine protein phosphatase [Streptomyces griseocarneus]